MLIIIFISDSYSLIMNGNGISQEDPPEGQTVKTLHDGPQDAQEIPHLQLVDAKSLSEEPGHKISDKSCRVVHVKEEPRDSSGILTTMKIIT